MKIGIDVTLLQIRGGRHGIGSYLRGLLPALASEHAHEYHLLAYAGSGLEASLPSERFRETRLPRLSLGRAGSLVAHQIALPRLAARVGLDLLHVPGVAVNASMPSIPLWQPVPVVVTVHDLTPLLFPAEILPSWRHRAFYRLMLSAVRRAARLLCSSRATRDDVVARLGVPTERITVAPLAPDPSFGATPAPPGDPRAGDLPADGYVLHVGGPSPVKNLPRLIAAMALLWATGRQEPLVLVSSLPFDPVDLCPAAAPHRARIRVLQGVASPFLAWLYRHAACLAFPSLYEGFGIPVLEAMASGCPVIASRVAALPEVGGGAALYVDPLDTRAIAGAIGDLLGDPARRRRMAAAGAVQVSGFTYAATARATLDAYERARRRG